MSNEDESIQTLCLKDILENYPEAVISRVLEKMRGHGHAFEEDTFFTQLALKKIWKEPKLAEEFMNIFDDYASCGRIHIFFIDWMIKKNTSSY